MVGDSSLTFSEALGLLRFGLYDRLLLLYSRAEDVGHLGFSVQPTRAVPLSSCPKQEFILARSCAITSYHMHALASAPKVLLAETQSTLSS